MNFLGLIIGIVFSVQSYSHVPSVRECGRDETTIEERVKDCSKFRDSKVETSSGVTWRLVTRTLRYWYLDGRTVIDVDRNVYSETWLDTQAGVVWTGYLGSFSQQTAHWHCTTSWNNKLEDATGAIDWLEFKLPSKSIVRQAYENGLSEVFRPDSGWYQSVWHWTSHSERIFHFRWGSANFKEMHSWHSRGTQCVSEIQ